MTPDLFTAQQELKRAVLRSIAAEHYFREEDPHAGAEQEYADELLALACRDLVRATEALPESERPIGWDTEAVAS